AQGGPTPLAAPCPALGGAFNRWAPLTTPRRPVLVHVAAFAQDPCTFVGATADGAVYRATDGRTWSPAVDLEGLDEVAGVVSEEMPVGTAFVFGAPLTSLLEDGGDPRASGLYVTRDFGATFQAVPDLAGYSVSAVAAAPSDPQVMYAAASPLRGVALPLVLKSTDFGRTWLPLPGSLPVRPTRLAVDARLPGVVWANSTLDGAAPSSGVWRSNDGGVTFTRMRDETVVDFDTAPVPGGGSRVDMATAGGLVRTRDGGQTYRTVTPEPVAAVTHERFAPDALMAVVGDAAVRSTTAGRTFRATPGLPGLAGCTVTDLTRNEEFPSHFLMSLAGCGAAGHYVYRSDGRDLLNVEDIGGRVGTTYVPALERLPRSEMRILREIDLPENGDTSSGSLGFDGEMLYYTNNDDSNEIHVSTTTGEHVRTITLAPNYDVRTLTYDPQREVLWALINEGGDFFNALAYMYKLDPVTGRITREFESPLSAETTLSMDPTAGVFRSYQHHGYEVYEISVTGQIVDRCTIPAFPVDPNVSTHPDRGHPENTAPGFASGLAVGGGRMYLQLEDDRTIYHVSKDCELLAVFEHRRFSESFGGPSSGENDQMACDTVTFGQPAIWIRDAGPNIAVAYAVPNGYCPLDSKLTMTPPQISARSGDDALACALLLGDGPSGTVMPVGGAEVTFFASDVPVAAGVTDDEGFACASFPAPPGRSQTIPLEAAFFGTISFRASLGTGTLETFLPPFRVPAQVPPPPPPPDPPQVVLALPPPPPLPLQLPAANAS
ncbi:MAG: hypothetical protein M3271_10850, partial [Actinomycetota bacterium]|nr:hypothetical protein [Actinomycetota bacterium]